MSFCNFPPLISLLVLTHRGNCGMLPVHAVGSTAQFSFGHRRCNAVHQRSSSVHRVCSPLLLAMPPWLHLKAPSLQSRWRVLTSRNAIPSAENKRSWFGPNGQYIRELPCPSCRGRGYTPCPDCGVDRSRSDCCQCNGKGVETCCQCSGECVIWEESYDERPWEKARSSSLFKVKEDDEVDSLEIKMEVTQASKRIYRTPSREVSLKISRSLRVSCLAEDIPYFLQYNSLNAKTGLFSKRMKIIHQDPLLHAQRSAAVKRTKATPAARRRAAEISKAYFTDPENRLKRSLAMKGVKFYCSYCGEEGHRRYYCKLLRKISTEIRFRCSLCGERGHNRRTCLSPTDSKRERSTNESRRRHCNLCGQSGHYRTTCAELIKMEACSSGLQGTQTVKAKRSYFCKLCLGKGHNKRACPDRKGTTETSTKTHVPE